MSSDGHEFIVKRDHALTSGTIKVGKTFNFFLHLLSKIITLLNP